MTDVTARKTTEGPTIDGAAGAAPPLSVPELDAEPESFSFFQAVRLLRRLDPDRAPVGRFDDPADEVVRFGANPELAFPPGEIETLEQESGGRWKMTVNFLGLVGNLGVLPTHYSVLVKQRIKARDTALRDFLDIFHHRVASLFYRALERTRFYVQVERGEEDGVTPRLYDLLGIGESARGALGPDAADLLGYVGLLAPRSRSALALEQLIEDRFGVPTIVEQFVGGWYDVSSASQCRIDDESHSYSQRLGVGALVGDEIWDPQARARIVLGPLSKDRFEDFLPTGGSHRSLQELTRFFTDDEVEFELKLLLVPDEVPPLRLGADDESPLGWGSWIRSGAAAPDEAETVMPL